MKVRLQRFLADCGVASRRECEALIQQGRVSVNGEARTEMPVMIDPAKDKVTVDDSEVREGAGGQTGAALKEERKVYFLLNKPKGILVTTSDPSDRKVVGELMVGVKERVFPVGRLDMESRGALIMTNDGELANRLTHPRYGIEKTYVVEVDGKIGHADLEKIKGGMWLGPEGGGAGRRGGPERRGSTRPAEAVRTDRFKLKLIGRERGRTIIEVKISEGKNREIRRVMARVGHVVRDLNRVAIAGKITTKGIAVGEFRPLTEGEVAYLFKASAPEAHVDKRAATQAWYEKKEMEKERKRLAAEEAAGKRRPVVPVEPSKKPFRKKPVPKGKKPFVPPTGRNAGKALGGNFIGRQRFERQAGATEGIDESALFEGREVPAHEDAETIKREVRAQHPLGGAAGADEE